MTSYVVTVTPENPTSDAYASMTLRVITGPSGATVQEFSVRSATRAGLGEADLPDVDLRLLIRAFSSSRDVGQDEQVNLAQPVPRTPASGAPAAPAALRGPMGSVPAPAAAAPSGGVGVMNIPQVNAQRVGGTQDLDRAERAYRRMPDPEEVIATYRQMGTITALAAHYGVPRHTAQGWASRLRRKGFDIGRH